MHIEHFARRRAAGSKAALVIAPKSLLQSAWEDDFKRFAPHLVVSVAPAEKRKQRFDAVADVYVTNIDAVNWLVKQPKSFFDRFDTLILDELSAFKHHNTARAKAINKIKKYFSYRYGLTGTPAPNTITELWHQIFILDDGQRLGKSFFHFRNSVQLPQQVGPQPNMLKWTDRPGAELAVNALLDGMVIRHKFEECISIPENHEYSMNYYMPTALARSYKQMKDAAVTLLNTGKVVTAVNAASLMGKLLQIASGAVYHETDPNTAGQGESPFSIIDTSRAELVASLVKQRAHSLVFFIWKHQKAQLIEEFRKEGISFAVIDGTTPASARQQIVQEFQAGFYQALLAHPQSAAHGLTLTKASTTIWTSPTPNLEFWLQGNRRIYRAGQTQKTETISILAPDTVEMRLFNLLTEKNARQLTMLDLLQESFKENQ